MAVYQWFLSALKQPTHMQTSLWSQLSTAWLFWRMARVRTGSQSVQDPKQMSGSMWRFLEKKLHLEFVIPFVQKVHTAKACADAAPICKFFLAADGPASWAKSTLQTGHTNKQGDVLSRPREPGSSNSVCKWTKASITVELSYKIQRLYKEKLPDISWCNTNSPQVKNKKFGCCDISVEAWLDMSCTTLPIPIKS